MAGKFVEMKEAAELLGVSPDELNDLRSNGEIHGYRDGTSWKFKMDEVQRFADERGIELGAGDVAAASAASAGRSRASDDDLEELISLSDADEDDDSDDSASILVSEQSLGQSGEGASSTVIGKEEEQRDAEENDIKLAAEDELQLEEEGELQLSPEDSQRGADRQDSSADLDLADLEEAPAAKTAKPTQQKSEPAEDDFSLSDEGDDDDFALSDDEDLLLATDEPAQQGGGSDVTLRSGDSGINLTTPSDSGLSLEEEPLDLGGGSSAASLELPSEDEDLLALDEESESDEVAELQQDEEFQLGPTDEMSIDESDSGSQVIALEDSEEFDEGAAVAGEAELLEAEEADLTEFDQGPAPVTTAVPGMGPAPSRELPEAPYSVWNVLGLVLIAVMLMLGALIMLDLVRNMWSWNEPYAATTSITDGLADFLFGN